MSQFYDQASLVMVPSGYKNGKVYSQKPLSTDGELTFTRSNDTATRVNSSGLIEKVRTNVALYSNDFSNAAWAKLDNATVSGIRVADPFGGNTAWQVIFDGSSNGRIEQTIGSLINNGTYTTSFYLRVASGTVSAFVINDAVTITTTWQRFSSIETITGTDAYPRFRCNTAATIQVYAGQFELSDFGATDYIATTSAAVSVGPVANLPRLDYSGGATCPSVLLEGQRTNQILQSEAFGSASWAAFNASVSSNISATLDPQGYYGADKLVEDSSSSFHDADQVQTYTAAPYTISVFAKAAGRDHIFLQHFDGVTFFTSGTFNLANGTVSGSGSIEAYSNGWYRCSFTATTVSGTGKAYVNLSNGTTGNYQGDGTSGVYLWGAMLEQGSHSTSYINTLSAAVTRGADECRKGSISSLIGQTEGTLFAEFEVNPLQDSLAIWTRNSATGLYGNMIYLGTNSSNQSRVQVVSGSTVQADIVGSTLTAGFHKFAVAYKNNDFAFYVDGVQIGTASSGTIPTGMNELYIDQYIDGGIRNASKKQVLLFKTRLTNAQLAELTTL